MYEENSITSPVLCIRKTQFSYLFYVSEPLYHTCFVYQGNPITTLVLCIRVVFNEVVQTTKDYMRDVTVIQPEWLCEIAPDFYQFGTVS